MPSRPTTFPIKARSAVLLLLLQHGEMNGAQLTAAALEMSDGGLRLLSGTLYPLLDSLVEMDLVNQQRERRGKRGGRPPRWMSLTEEGRRVALVQKERLLRFLR